jgi:hypothetical protein
VHVDVSSSNEISDGGNEREAFENNYIFDGDDYLHEQ